MPNTTNFNWATPADTDLVKDGAAAIRTLGNSIDSSFVDLKGGTTGQVLAKNSNTDLDFTWATDASGIPATIFDAKGDLIAASAADTASRLAVGANDTVLTADSSTATGLKWAAPAVGGKVLQVIYADTTTTTSITTATYADSTLSASITPSAATSKVLVMVSQQAYQYTNGNEALKSGIKILRGATDIWTSTTDMLGSNDNNDNDPELFGQWSFIYLDSPSTTSATTYKTQGRPATATNGNRIVFQNGSARSSMILMEIGA